MASFISENNSIAEKKALIQKIQKLLKIETCDEDCNNLLDVIEDAKNDCNKLYKPSPGDPDFNYEKGAWIRNSACSDLTILQRKISDKTGGKSKKNKSKKNKSKKNKSKKNKSKKNKSRTLRRR